MKVLINTIGKKIHTLVIKNIPRSTCSKKRLAGRSFFQNSGSQGPGRISPGGSIALEPFFHVFQLSLNGVFIVIKLNYHIKASVKLIEFVRENQIIPWQGVFFLPKLFYKNHRNIML